MKTFNRTLIGLISSVCAIAGCWRMAERLDPLTQSLGNRYTVSSTSDRPADNCTYPCMYSPDAKTTHLS